MRSAMQKIGMWCVVAPLLLAACSGGGDEAAPAPNATPAPGTGAASSPAPAPGTMPMPMPMPPAMGATITSTGGSSAQPWSSPAAWAGGRVPMEADMVVVAANTHIELDGATPRLAGLMVEGQLSVRQGATATLTADHIMVGGTLRAGSESARFAGRFDIVLSGTDPSVNIMAHGAKVLMLHDGGTLALYGQRKRGYSRLDGGIAAGAARFTVTDVPTGWQVGDEIAVAPTDFEPLQAEKRRITAIAGRTVTVDAPFTHAHWGGAPEVHGGITLDMRAHVANLSRNIRVTSIQNEERMLPGFDPDAIDANGQQIGRGKRPGAGRFGGHMAFMRGSFAQLDSVEVTQLGQQGVLARYPIHWHLLGDSGAEGNFLRHASVHGTFQRGVVIHQTNGVEIEDNVMFDIPGHAVYLEDGIEHDNTIDRNVVMLVRYVPRKHRLSLRDREKDRAEKLSGFWITNPANRLRDNVVAGVQNGWGFIFANVEEDKIPVIDVRDRNWVANREYIGFDGNIAYAIGFMPSVPDGGDSVFNLGYGPEEAGSCFRFNFAGDYRKSRQMTGLTAFKCANAAFWSTNFLPIKGAVVADSRTAIVNNQGEGGVSQLQASAVVGMTANNPAGRTGFDFGPFTGPNLKEHLEAGPVTLDNVITSYAFKEAFDGLAPALNSARSAQAGFRLSLPEYVAVKANGTSTMAIGIDRSGGYSGAVDVAISVPKPPNLATENPYYALTSDPLTVGGGVNAAALPLRNGAADRAGDSVVVVRATGDATLLSTVRVLSATAPMAYSNAAQGHNLARLIPGDTPRNPQMSGVVQNAAGQFAIDGNATTAARFEGAPAPWIRLDVGRSYWLKSVVIEWDPAYRPSGDLVLSVSEFGLLEGKSRAEVLALPADQVTNITIPDTGASRIEVPLPAGTAARQVKLWTTRDQLGEVRLREIGLLSQ